MLCDNLALNLK